MDFLESKRFADTARLGFWIWESKVYMPDGGARATQFPQRWSLVEYDPEGDRQFYSARPASNEEIDLWETLASGTR